MGGGDTTEAETVIKEPSAGGCGIAFSVVLLTLVGGAAVAFVVGAALAGTPLLPAFRVIQVG